MEIVLEHSHWYIPLCLVGGVVYATALYYGDRSLDLSGRISKAAMFTMRFVVSTTLLLLLLSPMIRTQFSDTEEPVVIFIQDNSESVLKIDSSEVNNEYLNLYSEFIENMKASVDIRTYLTGSSVRSDQRPDFSDKESDLSSIVDVIKAQFTGRNLAAVILASDGLYNKGGNPIYAYQKLQLPVHVVPMGDTVLRADIRITRVRNNNKALFGNTFPVEVFINADDCDGQTIDIKITSNNEVIRQEEMKINGNRFSRSIIYYLEAKEKGLQHYSVLVEGNGPDYSAYNNSKDFFVEVIDRREKVLILAGAPHPDVSFIKRTLENTLSYDVTLRSAYDFQGSTSDNDLLILHGLPKSGVDLYSVMQMQGSTGSPYLMILGAGSDIPILDDEFTAMRIADHNNTTGEVQPMLADNFSLFEMDHDDFRHLNDYPPLISPFGSYQPQKEVSVLLYQKVGQVKTQMPLLYFSKYQNSRLGILAGEGIWKWSLFEQREGQNRKLSSDILLKSVQYLLATGKNDPLNLFHKQSFHESENVIIDAELLNASGEFTNDPDMVLTLTNEADEEFDFAFSRRSRGYTLNMGSLSPGLYQYNTSVKLGEKVLSKRGQIRISKLQIEHNETKADHQLLRSIANNTNGKIFYPGQMSMLSEELMSNADLKPVTYNRASLDDIINLWQLLAILLLLLATEWVIRKRTGSY